MAVFVLTFPIDSKYHISFVVVLHIIGVRLWRRKFLLGYNAGGLYDHTGIVRVVGISEICDDVPEVQVVHPLRSDARYRSVQLRGRVVKDRHDRLFGEVKELRHFFGRVHRRNIFSGGLLGSENRIT